MDDIETSYSSDDDFVFIEPEIFLKVGEHLWNESNKIEPVIREPISKYHFKRRCDYLAEIINFFAMCVLS